MSLTSGERLKMLEWFDDFIKQRIDCQKAKPLPDKEIINIYKEQVEWNDKQRVIIARKMLKV